MELINLKVNFTQLHRLRHFDVIAVAVAMVDDAISLCCLFFCLKPETSEMQATAFESLGHNCSSFFKNQPFEL